jgi:hypothetical protein
MISLSGTNGRDAIDGVPIHALSFPRGDGRVGCDDHAAVVVS